MTDFAGQDLHEEFREAVAAIDAGDLDTLRQLLATQPALATARLETPGAWLREQAGNSVDGFFARPYLLWFVAEDPERHGALPENIVEIARAIIEAARDGATSSIQEQLDYALRLVAWSWVAARQGLQIPLIDLLIDAGADPAGEVNNALVNRHVAAAEHLLARGGRMTLAAAACLGRWDDMERLLAVANPGQRRFAFVLSALNGRTDALRRLLVAGADVNAPSDVLYSHGTPLHHAVCSGSLDAVKLLVEAGADLHRADTAWSGTPLGWAEYYVETAKPERTADYRAIVEYLRGEAVRG